MMICLTRGWLKKSGPSWANGGYTFATSALFRTRKKHVNMHVNIRKPHPSRRSLALRRLVNFNARPLYPASGITVAKATVTPKLTVPRTINMIVHDRSASTSVRPLILAKIQKPLSFIHEPINDPPPIAVAR